MAGHPVEEHDPVTGKTTTGHEWDGIKELNNPLPRWWLNIFYACILWAIGYCVVYPAWPGVSSYTKGIWEYSSREELGKDMVELRAKRAERAADLNRLKLAEIKADPKLLPFALAQGKAAFGDNCAPCHGVGGGGAKGYPNLNDDEWLWGGKIEDIHTTITHGVRSMNDGDTRISAMPAFGKDGLLKKEEIRVLANYVRSLSGESVENGVNLKVAAKLFEDNCAACHGDKGEGNKELGAPSLIDKISLYGAGVEDIVETITNSRAGVMPAWGARLDPTTIKSLALYVQSLGGGK